MLDKSTDETATSDSTDNSRSTGDSDTGDNSGGVPADFSMTAEMLEAAAGPLNRLLGIRLTSATPERVTAELPVTPDLHQPFGIVHGGVYCTAIESVTSVGAAVRSGGKPVVGLTNRTSFLRAVRDGRLTIVATPVGADGPHQTWQASITDERDRLIATGTVDLLELAAKPVAGYPREPGSARTS